MPPNESQPQDYSFITNPSAPPPKQGFSLGDSLPKKLLIIGGGLLILIIVFMVLRGLFGGSSNMDQFLEIAQDQQQIIVVSKTANEQPSLSTANKNSAITTLSSTTTDQRATLEYMAKNGKKVKPKDLAKTVNPNLTAQLTASVAAGTFDATYKDVMSTQLAAYSKHLKAVYDQADGKNGRELLEENYKNAQLLLQQLNTP